MRNAILGFTSALLGFLIFAPTAVLAAPTKTLRDLQAAYNGESNAHVRYLAFAKQAEKEGYGDVASLFRAAAASEEIHLKGHAAVIRQLGAVPQAKIQKPVVKSTKVNLENSASKGEAYERDTMYPRFIRQAKADGVPAAVQSFEYARAAEAEHFKLFTYALHHLNEMKGSGREYYVCTTGGYTMAKLDASKCPEGKYETIH